MKNNNQHHRNLTGGSPKQVPSLEVFVKSHKKERVNNEITNIH